MSISYMKLYLTGGFICSVSSRGVRLLANPHYSTWGKLGLLVNALNLVKDVEAKLVKHPRALMELRQAVRFVRDNHRRYKK